jgi:2-alkenal reductase
MSAKAIMSSWIVAATAWSLSNNQQSTANNQRFEVQPMSKHSQNKKSFILPLITILFVVALVLSGCSNTLATDAAHATAAKVAQVQELVTTGSSQPEQQTSTAAPTTTIIQSSDQEALADLYERVVPSVVNIQVTGSSMPLPQLPEGFPNMPDHPDIPMQGEGSGWVYDDQGHIITNNHVVEGADKVIVVFDNGLWDEAEIVATDPQSDLAVIKVDAPESVDLKPLPLADPENLRVGYSVIAIGVPFGLESTMTTGIVSALGRSFPVGNALTGNYTLPAVIQTDAAINPGNSGGPLLNLNGEVVGVNFAIESPIRANSGVGFAIPVSIIQRVVPALLENGEYDYPYLGISGQSVTPQLAEMLELPQNVLGAYVDSVVPDGPAGKAGVQGGDRRIEVEGIDMKAGGDIIIAMDDEPVRSFEDLVSYLVRKTEPGQKATLTVLRDGDTVELDVVLGERPTTQVELSGEGPVGGISAKAAIAIARDTVAQENLLDGPVNETVVTQDELDDGQPVWTVELSDASATATVVIDAMTGDVLDASVK